MIPPACNVRGVQFGTQLVACKTEEGDSRQNSLEKGLNPLLLETLDCIRIRFKLKGSNYFSILFSY